eukprot:SRR837773.22419.p4 GENE.SRR837773.22419~~SRR837773.22419.p4  ORF type:complete len:114 (-),score=10.40 SRR837773.22419:77-418(-)
MRTAAKHRCLTRTRRFGRSWTPRRPAAIPSGPSVGDRVKQATGSSPGISKQPELPPSRQPLDLPRQCEQVAPKGCDLFFHFGDIDAAEEEQNEWLSAVLQAWASQVHQKVNMP